MASTILGCSHAAHAPLRGMRAVALTDETVLFRCARCFAEVELLRCSAITRAGRRCSGAALIGFVTCKVHRSVERLGLVEGVR